MKIGELATAAQTKTQTIRYYEREGLLPRAPRTEGHYRIYCAEQIERLNFIRHCRSLDMTLAEVRALLRFKDDPQAECAEVDALLDEHIGHVASRIRELKQLAQQLKLLRAQCAGAQGAAHCAILTELTQAPAVPAKLERAGQEHMHGAHGRSASHGDHADRAGASGGR